MILSTTPSLSARGFLAKPTPMIAVEMLWVVDTGMPKCAAIVSTAIAPTTGMDARRALAFNWQSRVGYLAIGELDGVPYLQLCENRPYDCVQAAEIDRLVLEIGGTGDAMERRMSADGDLL